MAEDLSKLHFGDIVSVKGSTGTFVHLSADSSVVVLQAGHLVRVPADWVSVPVETHVTYLEDRHERDRQMPPIPIGQRTL